MSKKCELTGKSPLKGHTVSHANNKLKRNIKLKVSNAALRTVDYKGGLDDYLKGVRSFKLSSKAKKIKNQIIAKA